MMRVKISNYSLDPKHLRPAWPHHLSRPPFLIIWSTPPRVQVSRDAFIYTASSPVFMSSSGPSLHSWLFFPYRPPLPAALSSLAPLAHFSERTIRVLEKVLSILPVSNPRVADDTHSLGITKRRQTIFALPQVVPLRSSLDCVHHPQTPGPTPFFLLPLFLFCR